MQERREARLAMRKLLEARGIEVGGGGEMDFLPKRRKSQVDMQ
jgi:hypothetical protein